MQKQGKFLAVESIRGIACFMVLLSHLSLTFFPYLHSFSGEANPSTNAIQRFIYESPFGFFYSGTSAVYIFFVLSGFILTKVALKDRNSPFNIVSMGIKRYPRLMIPALASCLIAYAVYSVTDINSPELSDWINRYGSQQYSFIGALYNGMFKVFFLSGDSPYNPVLWTMKIELFGSFVIYLLCLNRMTSQVPFLLGIAFLITAILTATKIINPSFGLGIASFYGGYLFSLYGAKISNRTAIILASLGLYLAGVHNTSASYSYLYAFFSDYTYSLGNFASGFCVVYAILFNEKLNTLFSGKILVFMGKVSFFVYLIHIPILSTLGVFLFNLILQYSGMYVFSALATSIITILLAYLFSLVFYKKVDVQGMKFSSFFAKSIMNGMLSFNKALQRAN